ncbi:MAG: SufD family Fe-S cluster assembly protein [Deltaproteobacteria bacterium]|nr:SufD family Fe-S cluster assembly protein [Deltaproteobacteria bacterium]PWB63258.1 MAG: SufBD protein [Deltaproteobacteria bacterium]
MADYTKEFLMMTKAYEASGGDPASLSDGRIAGLTVSHRKILRSNDAPGVRIDGEATPTGVKAKITVDPGANVEYPVHLCFGVLPKEGIQEIVSEFHVGDGAKVTFLAHCVFPNAVKVRHVMDARIHVGKHASLQYSETHYHGEEGGVEVLPTARIVVDEGGTYRSLFKLVQGTAGDLRIDYEADIGKNALCEMDARVYGKRNDSIRVKESLYLNGEKSRGLAKSRIVASDHCVSEVVGEAIGNAPGARGHVDCLEIVKGKDARASAVPRLLVVDDRAKLTHEAAIGSVDKKQVETLMARGLTEEESVDIVVRGILR